MDLLERRRHSRTVPTNLRPIPRPVTSQLRVLVAPTRVCQLVTPALEERCSALGQDGKDNDPVCKGAHLL